MKISENDLISAFAAFLLEGSFVNGNDSHFEGDSDESADIELALEKSKWPKEFPDYLLLEAKSHHSKDSPNTINKVFGQLLKETGKCATKRRPKGSCCLGAYFGERAHPFRSIAPTCA